MGTEKACTLLAAMSVSPPSLSDLPALSAVLALARSSHDRRHAMIEAGLLNTLQRLCERTGETSGRWEHVPKDERELARKAMDWLEHGDYMNGEGSYLG